MEKVAVKVEVFMGELVEEAVKLFVGLAVKVAVGGLVDGTGVLVNVRVKVIEKVGVAVMVEV